MNDLIAQWNEQLRDLRSQLAAFEKPRSLHTHDANNDDTDRSKARIVRQITELEARVSEASAR